jgi:hypothetical protein
VIRITVVVVYIKEFAVCVAAPALCITESWRSITDFGRSIKDLARSITDLARSITEFWLRITDFEKSTTDFGKCITESGRSNTDFAETMMPLCFSVLLAAVSVRCAALGVTRGYAALAPFLNGETPVLNQVLQSPVESAAFGNVAEPPADVVAVEDLREIGERVFEIPRQIPARPHGGGGGRRLGGRGGGVGRPRRPRALLGDHHPGQIERPDLKAVGGLQGLDAGAQLAVEPLPAPFVLFAGHHDAVDCITTKGRVQHKRAQRAQDALGRYRFPDRRG